MARITPEIINELKAQADIVSVIERFVPLKKQGNRWLGVCPFHDDTSPSMNVTPALGIYKCFACGAAGDVIKFVQEHEKLDFTSAVELVADSCSYLLPEEDDSPAARERKELRARLMDANLMAAKWFSTQLSRSSQATEYLQQRNVTPEIIEELEIGWAPESWDGLMAEGVRKGVAKSDLIQAGLVTEKDSGKCYDKFRGRLIFPIHNLSSKAIAFGGRVLEKDAKPKYLNSPETLLYNKSETLYGLHLARKHIADSQEVIFVEGYFDFLRLYQHGIKNVVSVSGTALTEQHAKVLQRYAKKAYLVFDGDAAGRKAARRSLEILLPTGMEIRTLLLPEGEDPDSMVDQKGPDHFRSRLETALNFVDFMLGDKLIPQMTPEELSATASEMQSLFSLIRDQVIRTGYQKMCADRLGLSISAIQNAGRTRQPGFQQPRHTPKRNPQKRPPKSRTPQRPTPPTLPPGDMPPPSEHPPMDVPPDMSMDMPPDFSMDMSDDPMGPPPDMPMDLEHGEFSESMPSHTAPQTASQRQNAGQLVQNNPLLTRFCSLILNNTILHPVIATTLDPHILRQNEFAEILDYAIHQVEETGELNLMELHDGLPAYLQEILSLIPDESWSEPAALREYAETILRMKKDFVNQEWVELKKVKSMESIQKAMQLSREIREIDALKKELASGNRTPEDVLSTFLEH